MTTRVLTEDWGDGQQKRASLEVLDKDDDLLNLRYLLSQCGGNF